MKKQPTETDILRAIRQIEKLLQDGWSLSFARHKSCGGSSQPLYLEVSKHPSYQPILLNYCQKKGFANQYTRRARDILGK